MDIADIRGLTVRYGSFVALQDFTCRLQEGCTGLLGPNGAGKTTFLKTMLGLVDAASGGGQVFGQDIVRDGPRIRQLVGYMPEQDCHIPGMSAVEFVAYVGELAGLPPSQSLRRSHEVLEYCGLGEARYRQVDTYSTGMKQRIKLAQALVHGPKLLLLDEPTNGLDPRGREDMLDLVRSVSHGKGLSVLVCSHLLKDIERTCDQVVVLLGGRLRAQGTMRDLKSIPGQPMDVELRGPSNEFVMAAAGFGLKLLAEERHTYRLQGEGTPREVARSVFDAARLAKVQVRRMAVAEKSLEDAFLEAIDG